MTRATLITTLALLLVGGTLLSSCGRDASDAGAKLIGVGFDPGTVQPAPKPTAGLVDFVNLNYEAALAKVGMIFSGKSPDGRLPEIMEIPGHPWYVGVQFHPELKSKPFDPHPLFTSFIRAAIDQSRLV